MGIVTISKNGKQDRSGGHHLHTLAIVLTLNILHSHSVDRGDSYLPCDEGVGKVLQVPHYIVTSPVKVKDFIALLNIKYNICKGQVRLA